MAKPHKGSIVGWRKHHYESERCDGFVTNLGYIIRGTCVQHPNFGTSPHFHTSLIVHHDLKTGEVETLNSRYTLVGPEAPVIKWKKPKTTKDDRIDVV